MKTETKEHYFARLDDLADVGKRIVELQKQLESLRCLQADLMLGPDSSEMKLVSSKTLIKWGEEWREKKAKKVLR